MVSSKIITEFLSSALCLFHMIVRKCNKETPCTHDASTVILIKFQSCSASLRVLLVCVRSYLKSVLSYRFLILDTCLPGILFLREQGCEDP
jgi:hypothetical protein